MKLLPELPQEIMQDILARSIHNAGSVQHCVQLLMVSKKIGILAKSSGKLRVNGVDAINNRKLLCFLWAWRRPVSSMVTVVDLSDDHLCPQHAQALARMMKKLKLTGLLSLNLSKNLFSDKGIRALATELGRFENLQSLNLADNFCNRAGGAALIPELSKLTALASLNLSKNDGMIMGDNVALFANALENLTSLTSLDLHSMTIWGDRSAMGTALGTLTNLTTPNLRKVTRVNISIFAHIGKLTRLTSLDLSRNHIWGVDGGRLKLGGLTALTSLNLLLNSFDDEDMEELVPPLRELTWLTFLGVGGKFTHSKVAPLEVEFEGRGAHFVVTGTDGYVTSDSEFSD
jgi:Leucine-rich repeat (LRR) protein